MKYAIRITWKNDKVSYFAGFLNGVIGSSVNWSHNDIKGAKLMSKKDAENLINKIGYEKDDKQVIKVN